MDSSVPERGNGCDHPTFIPPNFSRVRYLKIGIRKRILGWQSSWPFITSEEMSRICDIRILSSSFFLNRRILRNPSEIGSIFVKSDLLEDYLKTYHGYLNPKVLVTGYSDRNFSSMFEFPIGVKLWLCQNSAMDDPRIITLPIGIENLSLGRMKKSFFKFNDQGETRYTSRILVPPHSPTNAVRSNIIRVAIQLPHIFETKTLAVYEKDYFRMLSKYRFVLCLEGNGYDTHRVWETLYVGNFPVMLRTPWSTSLLKLGLPILLIDNVQELSHSVLNSFIYKNRSFTAETCIPLWMGYWKKIIQTNTQN